MKKLKPRLVPCTWEVCTYANRFGESIMLGWIEDEHKPPLRYVAYEAHTGHAVGDFRALQAAVRKLANGCKVRVVKARYHVFLGKEQIGMVDLDNDGWIPETFCTSDAIFEAGRVDNDPCRSAERAANAVVREYRRQKAARP